MAACWCVSPAPVLRARDDDLVPVKLRRGGRTLGGSLSWDQPQPLTAFSKEGPFGNMPVPKDVNVTRQVLAEPEAGLAERTWATLADGTPLVTATKRGKGMIVLFHVTADTRWSDLPLSGSFVEMLRRMVGLAGTAAATDEAAKARTEREVVPPTRILDGFGAFGPPTATTRPVPVGYVDARHRRSSARSSTGRRKDCWRSMRSPPPTGWSGWILPRCADGSKPIRSASRWTCAGRCWWRRSRCSRSTRWWCSCWPAALARSCGSVRSGRPRRSFSRARWRR